MPITIGSNINSLRTIRQLSRNSEALSSTFEKLSSGSRINKASDDAAGLSVAMALNTKARVNTQAIRNVNDGVSFLNVADGATHELKNILMRLRELATQSSNGVFSNPQRASLDKEAQALQAEYNRVINTAQFNGVSVFGGSQTVQAGFGTNSILQIGLQRNILTGDGNFQARQSYAAGNTTNSVIMADFNGDGIVDLATADSGNGTASVLLGNGDGTFKARGSFTTANSPGSIVSTDLNGDGILDLVTADAGSANASVLLGNGDGTFKARISATTGGSPRGIAFTDFNGDGIIDLAFNDYGNGTVSILLGNGDGTLQARQVFVVSTNPHNITTADFNGDGIMDLVTSDQNVVSVLMGNGNGTFAAKQAFVTASGANPRQVISADVNNDGRADLIVTDYAGNSISTLLGNGDGTFQAKQSFAAGTGSISVRLGDFNGMEC